MQNRGLLVRVKGTQVEVEEKTVRVIKGSNHRPELFPHAIEKITGAASGQMMDAVVEDDALAVPRSALTAGKIANFQDVDPRVFPSIFRECGHGAVGFVCGPHR